LPQKRAMASASALQLGQVRPLSGPTPDRELEGGSAIAATPALELHRSYAIVVACCMVLLYRHCWI
jgi:hypothetical protein